MRIHSKWKMRKKPKLSRAKKPQNLQALQKQWYAKLADSGFEDIEWTAGNSSPYLKNAVQTKDPYFFAQKQQYYNMAEAYLQNRMELRGRDRFIWKLHAEGATYEEITTAHNSRYKNHKSVYTIYYEVQKILERCKAWHTKQEQLADEEMLELAKQRGLKVEWNCATI